MESPSHCSGRHCPRERAANALGLTPVTAPATADGLADEPTTAAFPIDTVGAIRFPGDGKGTARFRGTGIGPTAVKARALGRIEAPDERLQNISTLDPLRPGEYSLSLSATRYRISRSSDYRR